MERCAWCGAKMTFMRAEDVTDLADNAWYYSLSQGWLCGSCSVEGAKIDAGFTADSIEKNPGLAASFYPHTTEKWFGQDWYEGRTSSPFEVIRVSEVVENLGEESGD